MFTARIRRPRLIRVRSRRLFLVGVLFLRVLLRRRLLVRMRAFVRLRFWRLRRFLRRSVFLSICRAIRRCIGRKLRLVLRLRVLFIFRLMRLVFGCRFMVLRVRSLFKVSIRLRRRVLRRLLLLLLRLCVRTLIRRAVRRLRLLRLLLFRRLVLLR